MCGRIVDYLTDSEIIDQYLVKSGAQPGSKRLPNYNLKPTQELRAVRLDGDGQRELALMRWGFVPAWSKEMPKQAWINAKAETMEQPRSTWKPALKARRCLVPVNGFYEWAKPEKGPKQPYYIHFLDGPMTFAGIWEAWHPEGEEAIESLAVATVAPSKEFSRFHDRQVVVLHDRSEQAAWLDPETPPEAALKLLRPLCAGLLQFRTVGRALNTPGCHGPECIEEGTVDALPKPLKIKRPARVKKSESGPGQRELL